jgi:hypothetical protein
MDTNMTRRRLLQLLVDFLGAVGVAPLAEGAEKLSAHRAKNLVASKLTEILPHRDSAAAVGREYLKIAPLEADVSRLIDLIVSPEKSIGAQSRTDAEALAESLRAKQRDDFEQGRTVLIQGWMLSQTEARLCALVSLI